MLLHPKYIFLLSILLGISHNVIAQFKGGNANGGDSKTLLQAPCVPPENQNIYFGGNANGGSNVSITQVICTIPVNGNIYFGGGANGASVQKLLQVACTTPENLSISFGGNGGKAIQLTMLSSCFLENTQIFYGGAANGEAYQYITNCPVAVPANIFTGGNTDGYSNKRLTQTVCTLPENTNVFSGGIADGYSIVQLTQNACLPPEALNLFFGGNSDGIAKISLTQTSCSTPENLNIFIGGDADGYYFRSLSQSVCPPADNFSIFLGSNADGYSFKPLTQALCAAPENTNVFMGGNSDGYFMGIFSQTICPTPENINIFLGGNSDGYFIQNLIQTVCTAPENINMFFGGNSDGYFNQSIVQTTCAAPENINMFFGGLADGFHLQRLSQSTCTSPENLNIFLGGNGGKSIQLSILTSCFPENTQIFYGGTANGESSQNITNCPVGVPANIYYGGFANGSSCRINIRSTCTTPENLNIYLGGSANGTSAQIIIRSACTPPENLNIYRGGITNGAANQRIIRSACVSPENLNIYLGGNANGASCQIIVRSICTLPENFNIYLGGTANGASIQTIRPSICPAPQNWNIFFGGNADGYATRGLIQPYYWTGAVDNNWHNPLNWLSGSVPDISSVTIITDVPNYAIISSANATSKSLILYTGSRLNINNRNLISEFDVINDGTLNISGTPIITIGGNLNGENGAFSSGSSKVIFNASTGIQTININTGNFYDVEINTNPAVTCQLEEATIIRNNLTITTGSLNVLGNNLSIGGNWSNSGSFIPNISTVIFNGINQQISNASGETFYDFSVSGTSQVTLNNNIEIENGLNLGTGIINTGVNEVMLGTGVITPGVLTYTTGRVIGKMRRWIVANGSYPFPVGTAGSRHTLTLLVNSGLSSGTIVVGYLSGNPGNGGLPISESGVNVEKTFTEGYWRVLAANGLVVGNYNLTLDATGFSSFFFNSEARVVKRDNGGSWTFDGTHSGASSPYCYRNNLIGGISTLGTEYAIGTFECVGGQISNNHIICTNDDVPAFVNVFVPLGGDNNFTYVWQYTTGAAAPGDVGWTNISSSNTSAYDYGALSATSRFVRQATAIGCGAAVYSNVLLITVNPTPVSGAMYRLPNQ